MITLRPRRERHDFVGFSISTATPRILISSTTGQRGYACRRSRGAHVILAAVSGVGAGMIAIKAGRHLPGRRIRPASPVISRSGLWGGTLLPSPTADERYRPFQQQVQARGITVGSCWNVDVAFKSTFPSFMTSKAGCQWLSACSVIRFFVPQSRGCR